MGGGGGGISAITTSASLIPAPTPDPDAVDDIEIGRYGLRTFRITSDKKLKSVWKEHIWDPSGVDVAQCLGGDMSLSLTAAGEVVGENKHPVPNENCHCGIYATVNLQSLARQYKQQVNRTISVVAAEGITIIGDRGMRTSAARIVAYWCRDEEDVEAYAKCEGAKRFTDIAEMLKAFEFPEYTVPVSVNGFTVQMTPTQVRSTMEHIEEVTGGTMTGTQRDAIRHALSFLGPDATVE